MGAAAVDDDRAAGCHDAGAGGAEEDGGDVQPDDEEGVSAEWTCAVDRAPRVCDSPPAVPCGTGWGRITQVCTADVEFVDSVGLSHFRTSPGSAPSGKPVLREGYAYHTSRK